MHQLQFEWVSVFIDGFNQILNILEMVSNRKKNDLSPVVGNIVFKEPPKIDEFNAELVRLESLVNTLNGSIS